MFCKRFAGKGFAGPPSEGTSDEEAKVQNLDVVMDGVMRRPGGLLGSTESAKAATVRQRMVARDRDGRPRWTTCDDGECAERFRNAGRASVESWLHRLLLACVLPSNRDATSRMRESCPQNLSTVFRAVERLKQRGCPAHWLVDFLNAMLAGKLRTACTPPGASPMPLPSGDPCRGKAESTMHF